MSFNKRELRDCNVNYYSTQTENDLSEILEEGNLLETLKKSEFVILSSVMLFITVGRY